MKQKQNARKHIPNSAKVAYYQLLHLGYDSGIIPSTREYTRFVVLATGRTGSTLLIRTLDRHPQIVTYGELFRMLETFPPHYQQFGGAEALYQSDPARFMDEEIFRKYPRETRAVGFKIFYEHAPQDMDWGKAVWDGLRAQPDLHVIHLRRRNRLRSFLSLQRAAQTQEWIKYSGKTEQAGAIALDHEAALAWFESVEAREQRFADLFSDHPTFAAYYEDISDDMDGVLLGLQRFLGVDPRPLAPATSKRSQRPLRAEISNYDELKAGFVGTPWLAYFTE